MSERLAGILQRQLAEHGIARRLPKRIAPEVWEGAVGKEIAARAQPTVLIGGTLHLLVQDHRWRDQLDAARVFLVARLNAKLGAGRVHTLQFGLAHEGALDAGRKRAGIGFVEGPRPSVAPSLLGSAPLDSMLREALLRAAEAAARKRA
jgi:predicted nucleic acid-binding Zn ribbon protein